MELYYNNAIPRDIPLSQVILWLHMFAIVVIHPLKGLSPGPTHHSGTLLEDSCHQLYILEDSADDGGHSYTQYVNALQEITPLLEEASRQIKYKTLCSCLLFTLLLIGWHLEITDTEQLFYIAGFHVWWGGARSPSGWSQTRTRSDGEVGNTGKKKKEEKLTLSKLLCRHHV